MKAACRDRCPERHNRQVRPAAAISRIAPRVVTAERGLQPADKISAPQSEMILFSSFWLLLTLYRRRQFFLALQPFIFYNPPPPELVTCVDRTSNEFAPIPASCAFASGTKIVIAATASAAKQIRVLHLAFSLSSIMAWAASAEIYARSELYRKFICVANRQVLTTAFDHFNPDLIRTTLALFRGSQ